MAAAPQTCPQLVTWMSPAQFFPCKKAFWCCGEEQQSQQLLEQPRTPRAVPAPPARSPRGAEPALMTVIYGYMGHIQCSWISPQAHNEITKFILVEKDTNKKDLTIPRSLAIPQSTQPAGGLGKPLRLFCWRSGAEAAAPACLCISSIFPG